MEQARSKARNAATYVLAASLFCLAGALVFFSLKISEVSQSLPAILQSVEQTSAQVEPVLVEVNEIRDLVPPVLEEVQQTRALIPSVLEEVRKTRELIPPMLKEVEQVRQQVPAILDEVEAARKQIPSIVKTADKAADAIVKASDEVAATRVIIPDVLDQVEKTREAIPPMLAKAEIIVDKAGQAGKKASEDAVAGVFTGIIKAPFKIVGGIGKSISAALGSNVKGLTDDDKQTISKLSEELLMSGVVGESKSWRNAKNGNEGSVSIAEIKTINGRDCTVLHVSTFVAGKLVVDKDVPACRKSESEWELVE